MNCKEICIKIVQKCIVVGNFLMQFILILVWKFYGSTLIKKKITNVNTLKCIYVFMFVD